MPTQNPYIHLFLSETLAGMAKVIARLEGDTLSGLVRRSILRTINTDRAPDGRFLATGEPRSAKVRAHLPEHLKDEVQALADETQTSLSDWCACAVDDYVWEWLDAHKGALAKERARRAKLAG